MKAAELSELGSNRKKTQYVYGALGLGTQAPGSVPGGTLSPNPLKRLHTIGLQVFLLFFFFNLNREPHLALSFCEVSEPPSLWRRGRPVGDTEGFTLDDLERNSPRSPPSGPNLQTTQQLVRPCCRGSLGSITCFQLMGRKEREPLFFPTIPIPPVPAPPFSVSVVQQRYRLHSRFRHTISPPLPSC